MTMMCRPLKLVLLIRILRKGLRRGRKMMILTTKVLRTRRRMMMKLMVRNLMRMILLVTMMVVTVMRVAVLLLAVLLVAVLQVVVLLVQVAVAVLLVTMTADKNEGVNEIMDVKKVVLLADETPANVKRSVKPSHIMQSPFLTEFTSGDFQVEEVGSTYVVSRMFPFNNHIGDVFMSEELIVYDNWVKYGLLRFAKLKEGRFYRESTNEIIPPFDFGVSVVSKKDFFHVLDVGGMSLTSLHMDILFYYLRKKGKYDSSVTLKFTTTDNHFDQCFQSFANTFEGSNYDEDLIYPDHIVSQYINGHHMLANTPWNQCDFVFIPFRVSANNHWALLVLDMKLRRLTMYNSLRTILSASSCRNVAYIYSVVLPYCLDKLNVFKTNPACDLCSPFFTTQGMNDPFDLVIEEKLPYQKFKSV
ncbi:uncharacterized protein LOC126677937 [Mercurialis annua]|uniref:uncharacterized protein LOC126677937 n=1 Tax=Mercurialis annua TaxID=3986 RepID=UPI00215E13DB|nr:uncharacterized protein LOC126677937 [Mercurialis annua]